MEVKAGTVYIKELSAPAGYKVDSTVYSLNVEAGKTATPNVSDTPKVTNTLIELFKIDMETQKDTPQGNASLEGAELTWKFYAEHYAADNLPTEPTKAWVTKTFAEKDNDVTIHCISRLADEYKVSGDSFYTQGEKNVIPLRTLTVEETKAPDGHLIDRAYLQTEGSEEQIKGIYVTQITEDGDLAILSGSNQYHVSDKVICGGVKIQKRNLETGDTKAQGSATLKDTEFTIISLNDSTVLVEGKLYSKGETVKTILTGIDGIAFTSADLLPYGKYRIEESKAPEGYLTDSTKDALLYNTYIIEELRGERNKGFELVPAFEIVAPRNNVTVDLGTLTDEYEKEISIHTTATGTDGEKVIVAGRKVTVIDTVTLDRLEKGTKYQLTD